MRRNVHSCESFVLHGVGVTRCSDVSAEAVHDFGGVASPPQTLNHATGECVCVHVCMCMRKRLSVRVRVCEGGREGSDSYVWGYMYAETRFLYRYR